MQLTTHLLVDRPRGPRPVSLDACCPCPDQPTPGPPESLLLVGPPAPASCSSTAAGQGHPCWRGFSGGAGGGASQELLAVG